MTRAFPGALELLVRHAQFHRDRRSIVTQLVGIPMTVFGLGVLLARPAIVAVDLVLTPAWLLWLASSAWYMTRGDRILGLAVSVLNGALLAIAHPLVTLGTAAWLACGIVAVVLGRVIQSIGHYYEGRKPAHADDPASMMAGPMFVGAHALFALGCRHELMQAIERHAGPAVLHDLAARA